MIAAPRQRKRQAVLGRDVAGFPLERAAEGFRRLLGIFRVADLRACTHQQVVQLGELSAAALGVVLKALSLLAGVADARVGQGVGEQKLGRLAGEPIGLRHPFEHSPHTGGIQT